jgi:hypothetical protein
MFRKLARWALAMALLTPSACGFAGIQVGTSTGTIFRYGNFCGKGWPILHATDHAGKLAELESIQPADDLDAACKRHDICYEMNGFSTPECDDALLQQMLAMRFGDPRCEDIAQNIAAFALSNPGQNSHGRANFNTLINVPLVLTEDAAKVPLDLIGKVIGTVPLGSPICMNGTGHYQIHMGFGNQ